MKQFFTILFFFNVVFVNAQVICGTAGEGGTVTLTAPAGTVFVSIDFASYGTPNGSCGSFTIGGCHAANSVSICSAALLGNNSGSVDANNGVFGDPCSGTVKRLYIQAQYSSILPLTLLSFTARITQPNLVQLDWSGEHAFNCSRFEVEKSEDGISFTSSGSIPFVNGTTAYHFVDRNNNTAANSYYRLKMIDLDGRFQYSSVLRMQTSNSTTSLQLAPTISASHITITCSHQQDAMLINSTGQFIKKIPLVAGSQYIDISSLESGFYFIKATDGVAKFVKQ